MIGTHGMLWRRVHIVVHVCYAVWGVCCTALHAAQQSVGCAQWAKRALLWLPSGSALAAAAARAACTSRGQAGDGALRVR
jgi:hypothetical protein